MRCRTFPTIFHSSSEIIPQNIGKTTVSDPGRTSRNSNGCWWSVCTNIFHFRRNSEHRLHSNTQVLFNRICVRCKGLSSSELRTFSAHDLISFPCTRVKKGPCVRLWYGVMDKAIKVKSPAARTVIKVGMDQLIFAPIFTAALVSTISYTQDRNIQSIKDKLRTQYTDILLCNYCVWPWVQIVNFRFVPLNYQTLFTQSVAFLWNIYVSWKTHSTEHKTVNS